MFKKIRQTISTIIFIITLLRAAQGLGMLAKDLFDEAKFKIRFRKNVKLLRTMYED